MAKKAICMHDNESIFLHTIVLSEPWWKLEEDCSNYTEEDIKYAADNYAEYKKLCIDYPYDYVEITLTDEEHNRIIKYKQETHALEDILHYKWHSHFRNKES